MRSSGGRDPKSDSAFPDASSCDPDACSPDAAAPVSAAPYSAPDASALDSAAPDFATPGDSAPDAAAVPAPDTAVPDVSDADPYSPDASGPDPSSPDASDPDPASPDASGLAPASPNASSPAPASPHSASPDACGLDPQPLNSQLPQPWNPQVFPYQTPKLLNLYAVGSVFDSGWLQSLYRITHNGTGFNYAWRRIPKMHLRSCESIGSVWRYIQILYHLRKKPYIVELIEVLEEEKDCLYTIPELPEGKNLSNLIIEETFTKANAAQVFKTVIEVLDTFHPLGVLHREISLDSFWLTFPGDFSSIKAINFGETGNNFSERVANQYYASPEVLNQCYELESDIWAAGVLLYVMICGVFPFMGDSDIGLSQTSYELKFDLKPWVASANVTSLVRKMLCSKSERWMTLQLLDHQWLHEQSLHRTVIFCIRQFA